MEKSLLFLFCGVNFLVNSTCEAAPGKVITIYGLEQGVDLQESSQVGANYILQAASFSNHTYATNFKNQLASRTDAEVRVIFSDGHYRVVLGPFTDAQELAQVSKHLLSKKPLNHPSHPHTTNTAVSPVQALQSSSSVQVVAKAPVSQNTELTIPEPIAHEEIQPLRVRLALNDVTLDPNGNFVALNDSSPSTVVAEPSPLPQIKVLRQNNQLGAARDLAINWLQKNPNDPEVLMVLGLIYNQQGEYAKAENCFNRVLAQQPGDVDARVGLINVKIIQKQYQAALDVANEGLEINPDDPRLLSVKNNIHGVATVNSTLSQIQSLRRDNQLDAARDMAVKYLETNPEDSDVTLVLGLIYSQQHNYSAAESCFNKLLAKDPTYVDARIALINVKIAQSQYQAALEITNEGLKLSPGNNKLLAMKKNIENRQLAELNKTSETNTSSGAPVFQPTPVTKTESSSSESSTGPITHNYANKPAPSHHSVARAPVRRVYHRPTPVTVSDLAVKQAKSYVEANQYQLAKQILLNRLKVNPNDVDVRIALADVYLSRNYDLTALYTIKQGLLISPDNPKLLIKKGEINTILYEHPMAANAYQHALAVDPKNKTALALLDEVKGISPRYAYGLNEFGISTDNAYVPDLHSVWDYSSLYYSRDTDLGRITGSLNYAQRQGFQAPQFQLDLITRINRFMYVDLLGGYSNQPALFPKFLGSGEAYFSFPNIIGVSAGAKYATLGRTFFSTYTGSLERYLGNVLLSFRPYYFVPKDRNTSVLYTGMIRKYFATDDHYVGMNFGAGKSPDLSDLLTVNFIVIKNSFVGLNYEFPILNHRIVVDLGAGYQRWQFPSGLIRKLYDGSIGLKYRF